MLQTPACGQWLSLMPCSSTTMSLTLPLAFDLWMCSQKCVGHRNIFMIACVSITCVCLDKTIQDGKKIPHWKPRSARFQFMGFSGNHVTSAPLVELHISMLFLMIGLRLLHLPLRICLTSTPLSGRMFRDSVFQYVDEEDLPPDDTSPFNDQYEHITEAVETAARPQPLQVVPPAATPLPPSPLTSVPFNPTPVHHSEILGYAPLSVASPLRFVLQTMTLSSPRSPSIIPAQQVGVCLWDHQQVPFSLNVGMVQALFRRDRESLQNCRHGSVASVLESLVDQTRLSACRS